MRLLGFRLFGTDRLFSGFSGDFGCRRLWMHWNYSCCTLPIRNWNKSRSSCFRFSDEKLYLTYKELKHPSIFLIWNSFYIGMLYLTYKELKLSILPNDDCYWSCTLPIGNWKYAVDPHRSTALVCFLILYTQLNMKCIPLSSYNFEYWLSLLLFWPERGKWVVYKPTRHFTDSCLLSCFRSGRRFPEHGKFTVHGSISLSTVAVWVSTPAL